MSPQAFLNFAAVTHKDVLLQDFLTGKRKLLESDLKKSQKRVLLGLLC